MSISTQRRRITWKCWGSIPSDYRPFYNGGDFTSNCSTNPVEQRSDFLVIWLSDDKVLGFSTADKIRFGQQANMHLHITDPSLRGQGIGVECVRKTAELYFRVLELKQLFCEPNAFNVAPNRTLQKAGFTYVKTHMTVPGPLNAHQAVTRWMIDRGG